MKGLQQAGLVRGFVLNCCDAASKTRMGNQKHPRKSCAHIQSAEMCTCLRRSSSPAQLCAPSFPSPGLLLLLLGEDSAFPGVILRAGFRKKHLPCTPRGKEHSETHPKDLCLQGHYF